MIGGADIPELIKARSGLTVSRLHYIRAGTKAAFTAIARHETDYLDEVEKEIELARGLHIVSRDSVVNRIIETERLERVRPLVEECRPQSVREAVAWGIGGVAAASVLWRLEDVTGATVFDFPLADGVLGYTLGRVSFREMPEVPTVTNPTIPDGDPVKVTSELLDQEMSFVMDIRNTIRYQKFVRGGFTALGVAFGGILQLAGR